MILIVDLTNPKIPLLTCEFIQPIIKIVSDHGYDSEVVRLEDNPSVSSGIDAIIICGTALADHWYLGQSLPDSFKTFSKPILGICAGMQILTLSEGGMLTPCLEIGMQEVRFIPDSDEPSGGKTLFSERNSFYVYALHQQAVICRSPYIPLAESDHCIQICSHVYLPRYGVLFHPEVRNEWIIRKFLSLAGKKLQIHHSDM